MKLRTIILVSLLIFSPLSTLAQQGPVTPNPAKQLNLMPVPAAVELLPGRLAVDGTFKVLAKDYSDARLQAGIARAMRRLEGRTGIIVPAAPAADENSATLLIRCQSAGQNVPSLDENESYRLEVSDKQVQLTAPTVVGALRGLETLLQLLASDRNGYYLPAIRIQDQPRFAWRGLLIDIGRHYQPPEVLKRNLDAMAAV